MSFFKTHSILGYGVVSFSGGEEYEDMGFERENGSFSLSLPGLLKESDNYIVVDVSSGKSFWIPHGAVDLITVFKDKDDLDDHLLHFELAAYQDEAEGEEGY